MGIFCFGWNLTEHPVEYLRDPNAKTALGILEIKKIVSMAQSVIKSWLKALLILGFCSRNTAKKLPKVPRLISTELTTPETQNFHSSKCCEKTEKLVIDLSTVNVSN